MVFIIVPNGRMAKTIKIKPNKPKLFFNYTVGVLHLFCPFIHLPFPSHASTILSIPLTSLIPHNYLPNPFSISLSSLQALFLVILSTLVSPRQVPWFSPSSTSLCCTSFPLIPSQRPPDIGVSVIPPYVISCLILSISHD